MSIFGPVDDSARRRWQQVGLKGLNELVDLGAKKNLPPLLWRLPASSSVLAEAPTIGQEEHPRDVFEAWYRALAEHKRAVPRGSGFQGEGEPRTERTTDSGRTTLWAGFTLSLSDDRYPACDVTLTAEWFAEDFAEAVSP